MKVTAIIWVLVLVVGVLAAILLFSHRSYQDKPSGARRCLAQIETAKAALELHVRLKGALPSSLSDMDIPVTKITCPVTRIEYGYMATNLNGKSIFLLFDTQSHEGSYSVASQSMTAERVSDDKLRTLISDFGGSASRVPNR